MRVLAALLSLVLPLPALACGAAVCLVDPERLALPRQIDFTNAPAGYGPGHLVDEVLTLSGARFGERFAGQILRHNGPHDDVSGPAFGPLTLLAGEKGQNLSVVGFMGTRALNGYGIAGFPLRDAQGEGAIAVLFDDDQSAIALHLRGGEAGRAEVMFLRRDGSILARVPITGLAEQSYGFVQSGGAGDVAGIVLTNTDPQGIALDTIKFGNAANLG